MSATQPQASAGQPAQHGGEAAAQAADHHVAV